MKRAVGIWQFTGFVFTSILGTLLHFLYEWTGKSALVAPFSGVNESTWEHIKILFFPMLLFAVIQSFSFKNVENFWCIKLKGILLGASLIPIMFYTYNGVIGKSPSWINISIFFIASFITYAYEAKKLKGDDTPCPSKRYAILALCIITLLFIIFTYAPPMLNIFKDPLTGTYGVI